MHCPNRAIPNHTGRCAPRWAAVGWLIVVCMSSLVYGDSPFYCTPEENRQRLESMPPAEKEKLLRQKERFESLSAEEQQRLKEIHEALAAAPDGERLYGVLRRYCDWLKTLASAERAELAAMPPDERIARIRELMKIQEEKRVRKLANLSYDEGQAVLAWLDDMITPYEDELIKHLRPEHQQFLRQESDNPETRRKRIVFFLFRSRQGDKLREIVKPTDDDLERLLAGLSEPTRAAFRSLKDPEQQEELVRKWIFVSVVNPAYIPVDDNEINEFFTKLPRGVQAELERLPREEMRQELRRMYFAAKVGRGEWSLGDGGRPPMNRPGFSSGPPFRGDRGGMRGDRFGPDSRPRKESDRNSEERPVGPPSAR